MIINELLTENPQPGDSIDLEFGDLLISTIIEDVVDDGVVIKLDETAIKLILQKRKHLTESRHSLIRELKSPEEMDNLDDVYRNPDKYGFSTSSSVTKPVTKPTDDLPVIPMGPSQTKSVSSLPGSDTQTVRVLPTATNIAKSHNLDPKKIPIGQEVKLPDGSTYKFKKGDTLYGVLTRYNQEKEKLPQGKEPQSDISDGPHPNISDLTRQAARQQIAKLEPEISDGPHQNISDLTRQAARQQIAKLEPEISDGPHPNISDVQRQAAQQQASRPSSVAPSVTPSVSKPPSVTPSVTPSVSKPSSEPSDTTSSTKNDPVKQIAIIAAAETGGDYDKSFGDKRDKSNKIFSQLKGSKGRDGKPVENVISPESMFGKSLSELTLSQVQQFQRAREDQLPGAGAVGKYQFIPSTLNDLIKNLKLDPEKTVFDKKTQDLLQQENFKINLNVLKKANLPLDTGNVYMAHYIGPGGAITVNKAAKDNPDSTVADALVRARLRRSRISDDDPSYNAKYDEAFKTLTRRNAELATVKVGDFHKTLTDRVAKRYAETQKRQQQVAAGKSKPVSEAEYQGRNVPLGKPMQGDVKKSKVYVKGPKGNVVKVNFGDKNMKIKKSNPNRRKSFRARHNCDNPGPRWKARYWSCRAW